MIKIAVLTSDKNLWAMAGFAYLFNRFWSKDQHVDVVGFSKPTFDLPDNFNYMSLADENWPANKWTNQLMAYLASIKDDQLILMLEDYWLCEPVNVKEVIRLWELAQRLLPLRIDLTADRYSQRHIHHESENVIQTEPGTPYQMSYQAGIWNRKQLLEVLVPGETPWESELKGSKRLDEEYMVLAATNHPVKYIPVLRNGKTGIQYSNKFSTELQLDLLPFFIR